MMNLTAAYTEGYDAALGRYKLARKKKSVPDRLGFTAAGLAGTGGLSSILGNLALHSTQSGAGVPDVPASIAEIADAMKVQPAPEWLNKAAPAYDMQAHQVHAPERVNEAILAHELGHAKNWESIRNRRRGLGTQIARGAGMMTATPALLYAGMADDPSYAPALVHAGINIPTLLDEIAASTRGTKFMAGKHGLGQGLMKSKSLIPALGTYLLHAGSPLALTALHKRWNET